MASPQLENIGLALQGFSAGLQGQGPQFAQGLQAIQDRQQQMGLQQQGLQLQQQEFAQRQQMAQQQQQEAQQKLQQQILAESYKDAAIYNSFAKKGDWKSAEMVGMSFLQHAKQLAGQGIQIPQDAVGHARALATLARGAQSKDYPDAAQESAQRALEHSGFLVEQGTGLGILERPKGESEAGKYAADVKAGLITQAQADEAMGNKGTKETLQAVNTSTGDIIPIQHDSKTGKYTDSDGNPFKLPQGYVITHLASPQGAIEGIIPQGEDVAIKKQAGAVASLNDTAQQVIDLLKSTPDANTFVGSAASLANSAAAEAKAIGRHLGIDTEIYTPSTYNGTFKDLGVKNDVLKSLYTSLAFQAAAANAQKGQAVSNKDVDRFLKMVGAGGSDPTSAMKVLESTITNVNKGFDNTYKQFSKGKAYPEDLHMPKFPSSKDGEWEIVK